MVLTFCEAQLDRDIPVFQKGGNRSLPDVYLHTLWPEWLSVRELCGIMGLLSPLGSAEHRCSTNQQLNECTPCVRI